MAYCTAGGHQRLLLIPIYWLNAAYIAVAALLRPTLLHHPTCLSLLLRLFSSFFRRFWYALLSEQGVRPEMSALAASTCPKPTTAASAAAVRAVVSCLLLCWAEHTTFTARRATGRAALLLEACMEPE
jgi:hypothetical protein